MKKLLSIIVPVYKVEQYINKCLDSCVVDEPLRSRLEVIIINDGTPDWSAEMSREYVKRYPGYFRQIDKENGGHGSVWNLGLQEARGKYTRFLDSDDWLENLDLLIEKLEHCDADLVITPTLCHHHPKGELWKEAIFDMEFGRVYDVDTFDWLHNRSHRNFVLHHSCTYKTEIFRPYLPLFLEKQLYDDMILGAAAKLCAKSLVAYDFILYHYLMERDGQSIAEDVQKKHIGDTIKSVQHIIRFVEQHPADKDSTLYPYYQVRLPKLYNYGYKTFLSLPYEMGEKLTKEWDQWVRTTNPSIKTDFIRLYRLLPYHIYRRVLHGLFSIKRPLTNL